MLYDVGSRWEVGGGCIVVVGCRMSVGFTPLSPAEIENESEIGFKKPSFDAKQRTVYTL